MDNVNVLRTGFFALDFALPDTNGDIYKLSDHLKGNFAAVCFFSFWDSERISAYLKELDQGLPNTASGLPVQLIGLCPARVDELKRVKEKHKLILPILSDRALQAAANYRVIDEYSVRPSVYFSIFVIDDYFTIRFRACEIPGLSKFAPEEFKAELEKII